MNLLRFLLIGLAAILAGCASYPKKSFFLPEDVPSIDYSNLMYWAAHPNKKDLADEIPGEAAIAEQDGLMADVFFVHPTTFTGKRGDAQWNAQIDDKSLNEKTDQSTIKFQASIFNQAGKIFAPRYRQAHLHVFYTKDKSSAKKALDHAYKDVKNAFDHYLEHENQGRPIIIAAHSQGTLHAARLVKEYFDGSALADQLVVAYLVGMPVANDYFDEIAPCTDGDDVQCFCSWRTFRKDYIPNRQPVGDSILVTNPLNWSTTPEYAGKELHKGAVLRNFNKVYKGIVDAYSYDGMLWVSRPKFPWSFLFTRKNYHIADYNFFYINVRENAVDRVAAFLH